MTKAIRNTKEMLDRVDLLFVGLILLAVLLMAGCGGGGSSQALPTEDSLTACLKGEKVESDEGLQGERIADYRISGNELRLHVYRDEEAAEQGKRFGEEAGKALGIDVNEGDNFGLTKNVLWDWENSPSRDQQSILDKCIQEGA